MSQSDTNNAQPLEHWSSDDLEADADTRPNASTPRPSQELPHDAGTQSRRSMRANCDSQLGPTQSESNPTVSGPTDTGGAKCALDMTDERDRGMVRRALTKHPRRWAGVDAAFKAEMIEGLKEAAAVARECIATRVDPLDAAKVIASVVRTAVAIEDQCQKDEHRAEDHARMDNGQATQAVQLYGIGTPVDAV